MVGICGYRENMIITERSAITNNIAEYFKRVSIVPVQPVVGTEPHEAVIILVNTGDCVIGKALFNAQVMNSNAIKGAGTVAYEEEQE